MKLPHLFHRWGPWDRPYKFALVNSYQRRRCVICGKVKPRCVGAQEDLDDDA